LDRSRHALTGAPLNIRIARTIPPPATGNQGPSGTIWIGLSRPTSSGSMTVAQPRSCSILVEIDAEWNAGMTSTLAGPKAGRTDKGQRLTRKGLALLSPLRLNKNPTMGSPDVYRPCRLAWNDATSTASVLEIGRHFATALRQLPHDLLVKPDIHRGGFFDIAGEMQLLRELLRADRLLSRSSNFIRSTMDLRQSSLSFRLAARPVKITATSTCDRCR
jgi:hypothetical protein